MSRWYGPRTGTCSCCLPTGCPPCDLTYVSVTGFTSGGLCGNAACCDNLDGTYVFRTSGPVTNCNFNVFLLGECNCWTYPPDLDRWRIGGNNAAGCGVAGGQGRRCTIAWSYVGFQIKVAVEFTFWSYHEVCTLVGRDVICGTGTGSRQRAVYSALFDDCDEIPGSPLTLETYVSDSTSCSLSYEDGICEIDGLSVEVG